MFNAILFIILFILCIGMPLFLDLVVISNKTKYINSLLKQNEALRNKVSLNSIKITQYKELIESYEGYMEKLEAKNHELSNQNKSIGQICGNIDQAKQKLYKENQELKARDKQ